MKKELKQAVSRIRKAQDAVFSHKVAQCHCMSVDCNTLTHEDGQVITWWTIFCHKDSDPEKCRSWRLAVLGGDVNDMEHYGRVEMVQQQPQDSIVMEQAPQQFQHQPKHDGKKPPQAVLMELHTGKLLGLPMKIVYFIAAIIGGFLPLSGYYMWWKRRSAIQGAKRKTKE